jgi:hypothetical protein
VNNGIDKLNHKGAALYLEKYYITWGQIASFTHHQMILTNRKDIGV